MKSTKNLSFEPLSKENYGALYSLFRDDSSPYVQDEYKNLAEIKKYYQNYVYFKNISPKTTVFEWLMKLESTGEYIGLISLYDIILDSKSAYYTMCSIGVVTAEKFRGKGLTKEAGQALLDFAFSMEHLECITANTSNENIAALGLLESLGFSLNTKDHQDDTKNKYFELRKL